MRYLIIILCLAILFISGCSTNNEKIDERSTLISTNEASTVSSSFSKQTQSSDEVLSLVLKYCDLNESTIKLEDWPETSEDQDQMKNPIFFVYLESKPDKISREVQEQEYFRVYFGANYGDHVARYLTIFVKFDLSEIVMSEDIILDNKDTVINSN